MAFLLRGIFFDLDDTLIGYTEAMKQALVAVSQEVGPTHPDLSPERLGSTLQSAYQARYGYGTPGFAELATLPLPDLRRQLTDDALSRLGMFDAALAAQMRNIYAVAEQAALRAFPEVVETLAALRPHFYLGVITNGPSAMQREKLETLALASWFDIIVVDAEFGHPKPDPRIFAYAAQTAGLTEHELLFVGNSLEDDIAGARAAGWQSVWLNRSGMPQTEHTPDYMIARFGELLDLPVIQTVWNLGKPVHAR